MKSTCLVRSNLLGQQEGLEVFFSLTITKHGSNNKTYVYILHLNLFFKMS